MTKKAYTEAPMTCVMEMQLQNLMAGGSATVNVDGSQALDYESTEGDASGGLSRHHSVWDEEE